jgi:hypothetical protein
MCWRAIAGRAEPGLFRYLSLDTGSGRCHLISMSNSAPILTDIEDEEAAELAALTAAVEKARASKRGVPHSEMRLWLLEIAAGNFDAPPPEVRDL